MGGEPYEEGTQEEQHKEEHHTIHKGEDHMDINMGIEEEEDTNKQKIVKDCRWKRHKWQEEEYRSQLVSQQQDDH